MAGARLATGRAAAARDLFADLTGDGAREAWLGLAAACLALDDLAGARAALHVTLSDYAATDAVRGLAARYAARAGGVAWCAVSADWAVTVEGAARAAFVVEAAGDDVSAGAMPGQEVLAGAARLRVLDDGRDVLGSPMDLARRRRVEGVVALAGPGELTGWAWHPACPETDPVLTLVSGDARVEVRATDLSAPVDGFRALALPRGFRVAVNTVCAWEVCGPDGLALTGSPVGGPAVVPPGPRPVAGAGAVVVVPVHGDVAGTWACLTSVLATIGRRDRVAVVGDAPPDPAMAPMLAALAAADRRMTVLNADPAGSNVGFVRAANRGLAAAGGRDAVLLNSDTVVFPGWLRGLRRAAHSAPDVASATPLSNDASIFSFPDPEAPAPMPDAAEGVRIAALAARVNGRAVVETPTGHGFCLYLRADALAAAGLLREDLFAQGYGEENDWTERARALGWRHVAAPGVYVAHRGNASFGAARRHLLARNMALLAAAHPDYFPRVAAFRAADALAPARERLARAVLEGGLPAGPKALIVTHDGPGGTARVTEERAEAARQAGETPLLLQGMDDRAALSAPGTALPEAMFRLPREAAALRRMLARVGVARIELHHPAGHDPGTLRLPARLGVPSTVWVHDWGWLCPRLSLMTGEGRYCGEPPPRDCDACVAAHGQAFTPPVSATRLRARSRAAMGAAEAVIVATEDGARRIRRHFPEARVRRAEWETAVARVPAAARAAGEVRVAVAGAIGREKGYDVLLACARDAAARGLKLFFHVTGYTADDDALLRSGRAFVTGRYRPEEATALLRESGAAFGFLPSVWPETWCFALTDLWRAGLAVAVFDIGAPAERVRGDGRGWVLPLGLPPARVNDALVRLAAGPAPC